MIVKGTTRVDVDIDLKSVLIGLYESKVGKNTSIVSKDGKFYLEYSYHIENRGNEYDLTEITQNKYDALTALRDLITNFNYL
jgi:hypothetical protein